MAGKVSKRKMEKKAKKSYTNVEKSRFSEMRNRIINLKGKRFTGWFRCDLCGHNHSIGYLYVINEEEHEICKFCNDRIFSKNNQIRIIYTPMGNNQ